MQTTMILNDSRSIGETIVPTFSVFNHNNGTSDPLVMIKNELNGFCAAMFTHEELALFKNHYQLVKSLMRTLVFETSFYATVTSAPMQPYQQSEEITLALSMCSKQLDINHKISTYIMDRMFLTASETIEFWSLVLFSKLLYPMIMDTTYNYKHNLEHSQALRYYRQLLSQYTTMMYPISCSIITNNVIQKARYKSNTTNQPVSQIYEYLLDRVYYSGLATLPLTTRAYVDPLDIEMIINTMCLASPK